MTICLVYISLYKIRSILPRYATRKDRLMRKVFMCGMAAKEYGTQLSSDPAAGTVTVVRDGVTEIDCKAFGP